TARAKLDLRRGKIVKTVSLILVIEKRRGREPMQELRPRVGLNNIPRFMYTVTNGYGHSLTERYGTWGGYPDMIVYNRMCFETSSAAGRNKAHERIHEIQVLQWGLQKPSIWAGGAVPAGSRMPRQGLYYPVLHHMRGYQNIDNHALTSDHDRYQNLVSG
ncbi:MAG: hypothetical protein Q9177_006183, partial [Variospora cf. flavescens]